jgi:Protein of unknown function (DUF1559)
MLMVRITIRCRVNDSEMAWRIGAILLYLILFVAIFSERAAGQETRSGASGAGTAPLARHVPLKDLLAYLEFDGLDAHADAWRASAAYKLLNDTKLGNVLEDLALQGIEILHDTMPREQRVTGAEVLGFLKHITRNGFVVGVSRKGPGQFRFVAVLRHADRPEFIRLLELAGADHQQGDEAKSGPVTIQKVGRTLHRLGSAGIWLVEKGDLILTGKTDVDEVLAVQSGDQQSAMDHPIRAELFMNTGGFQPSAIGFIDMASLVPLAPDVVDLGLDGLKRIDFQWGFQDAALVSRLRIVAPAPRRGVFALLDQPTFSVGTLPSLPAHLTGLCVLSVDLAKTYDQVDTLIKLVNPYPPTNPPNSGVLARHGIDLRNELLGHLGPQVAFYVQAPRGDEAPTAVSKLMSQVAGFTLTAQVRDEAASARAIDSLIKSFNPMLREYLRGIPRRPGDTSSLAFLKFQKLAGPRPQYVLDLPPNFLPQPYVAALRPTVTLNRDRLVVSASTPAAKQALAGASPWQPDGAFIPVVKTLPADMVYLGLFDPRAGTAVFAKTLPIVIRQINAEIVLARRRTGKNPEDVLLRLEPDTIPEAEELDRLLFPSSTTLTVDRRGGILTHREAIPTLTSPATGAVLVALVAPAVQSSLETARRVQCASNLKQIALAMHNYHASNNVFARPATRDEKGQPLLSWRVAILPYLEQQELYDKFKLKEPWDSPHNKELLKEMPLVYRCPIRGRVAPFTTNYRVFVGKGALFEKDQDVGLADVTDGRPNTLMVVEAKEPVPWTKPDDLSFDPAAAPSLYGAGSPHPGGFHGSMANGSVRFFKNTIDLNVFRALITRAAGEIVARGTF